MGLPLFTAEASLYRTRQTYRGRSSPGADTGSVVAASVPAHPPDFDQFPCLECCVKGGAGNVVCLGQAIETAALCGPVYPFCLAAEWALCELLYLDWLGGECHLAGTPGGTPGAPCCPTPCSKGCCGSGETCAGLDPNSPGDPRNLCCSPGFTACGQNCCAAGETCLPDGSCCASASVCGGQNCCATGETCLPNGSCCPAGRAVCGGVCCPGPDDVCDPATNTCRAACPEGTASCGGQCCAAGQVCCNVAVPGGMEQQCVTPLPPIEIGGQLHAWCTETSPSQIYCNNICPAGQQCLPSNIGGLPGTDWYCQ